MSQFLISCAKRGSNVHWLFQQLKNGSAWSNYSGRSDPWKGKGQPFCRHDARRHQTIGVLQRSLRHYYYYCYSRKVSREIFVLNFFREPIIMPLKTALSHIKLCIRKKGRKSLNLVFSFFFVKQDKVSKCIHDKLMILLRISKFVLNLIYQINNIYKHIKIEKLFKN